MYSASGRYNLIPKDAKADHTTTLDIISIAKVKFLTQNLHIT